MRLLAPMLLLAVVGCRVDTDTDIEPVDHDGDGVAADDDCNDDDPDVFPGAVETCNGVDDDCDGEIDEGADDAATFYRDGDGDGYGDASVTVEACDQPEGYVAIADDCDDTDAAYHPGADESDCTDPNDYNCDGSVGYADADNDGTPACEDCDDAAASVNPNALEVCDGIDNDCDGAVDEAGAYGEGTFYADADADGFGDPDQAMSACDMPQGYVVSDADCDDANAATYPGASETCDGADNDCDGAVDEDATDANTYYIDVDGDGHGSDRYTVAACEAPDGYVTSSDDCDDLSASAYPGATEVCDGRDNDCDGDIDEDAVDKRTFYADADGDGFGLASASVEACEAPAGHVARAGDCDDTAAWISPNAAEQCNGVDDDCDGVLDNGLPQRTFYADVDGDGHGDPDASVQACAAPPAHVDSDLDCDDTDPAVSPDEAEVCNDGIDNDCSGDADCEDYESCKNDDVEICWECGDGFVDPDEACDDGNTDDDDGCSSTCQLESGCSPMAMDAIEITDDLWLCSLDRTYGGNTWVQTYSVCNEAAGFHLATVSSMTRRGLPSDPDIKAAMDTARGFGFQYAITGQPTRSCSWNTSVTSYESCNGLGYVGTGETSGTGSNWKALVDGNANDYRNWPSANTTNVHTLISMCQNATSDSAAYVFDHRWR